MSRHYSNESSRQKVALDLLKKIFASNKSYPLPDIREGTVSGRRQSGGHAYGPADVMETVVEIKNELGSGQADHEVQMTAYFAQMHRDQIDGGYHKALYQRFLFPTLGIIIIGALNILLTFYVDSRPSPYFIRSIHRIQCPRSPRPAKIRRAHAAAFDPISFWRRFGTKLTFTSFPGSLPSPH